MDGWSNRDDFRRVVSPSQVAESESDPPAPHEFTGGGLERTLLEEAEPRRGASAEPPADQGPKEPPQSFNDQPGSELAQRPSSDWDAKKPSFDSDWDGLGGKNLRDAEDQPWSTGNSFQNGQAHPLGELPEAEVRTVRTALPLESSGAAPPPPSSQKCRPWLLPRAAVSL